MVMLIVMVIIMAWFPDSFRTPAPAMKTLGSTAICPAKTIPTAYRGKIFICR